MLDHLEFMYCLVLACFKYPVVNVFYFCNPSLPCYVTSDLQKNCLLQ